MLPRFAVIAFISLTSSCSGDGGGSTAPDGSAGGDAAGTGDLPAQCAPADPLIGACQFTDEGLSLCNAFYGEPGANSIDDLRAECETATGDGDGVWQEAPCPLDDVQGFCLVDTSSSSLVVQHYYPGGGYQPGEAEIRCNSLDAVNGVDTTYCAP